MNHLTRKDEISAPFKRSRAGGFEFDPKATEVSILDRSGRPIWTKERGEVPAPIQWSGLNMAGQTVDTGDYICKIVYPNAKVAYLPFVFVKQQ